VVVVAFGDLTSVAHCERSRDYVSGGRGARGQCMGELVREDKHLPWALQSLPLRCRWGQ
jgi:hypothetical protein